MPSTQQRHRRHLRQARTASSLCNRPRKQHLPSTYTHRRAHTHKNPPSFQWPPQKKESKHHSSTPNCTHHAARSTQHTASLEGPPLQFARFQMIKLFVVHVNPYVHRKQRRTALTGRDTARWVTGGVTACRTACQGKPPPLRKQGSTTAARASLTPNKPAKQRAATTATATAAAAAARPRARQTLPGPWRHRPTLAPTKPGRQHVFVTRATQECKKITLFPTHLPPPHQSRSVLGSWEKRSRVG